MRVLLISVTIAASLLTASPARADIINGGFESGFTGWTVFDQPGGSGSFFIQSGSFSPISGFGVPPPPEGTDAAMSDQFGPGSHILFQDFTVLASNPILQFKLFVGNRSPSFVTPNTITLPDFFVTCCNLAGSNQQARVDIMDPAAPIQDVGSGVLQNLFQTNAGDPPVSGYNSFAFDLSAFAGQTVRLRFAEVDNQFFFQFGIDDVSVGPKQVPEPSSFVILGVGAGCLALYRWRRREAPTVQA